MRCVRDAPFCLRRLFLPPKYQLHRVRNDDYTQQRNGRDESSTATATKVAAVPGRDRRVHPIVRAERPRGCRSIVAAVVAAVVGIPRSVGGIARSRPPEQNDLRRRRIILLLPRRPPAALSRLPLRERFRREEPDAAPDEREVHAAGG